MALVRFIVWWLLKLRYRIQVRGLEDVRRRGRRGILFLPNHPALIDPVIMMALLGRHFAPRALADQRQVDRFLIRTLARRSGVRTIPDLDLAGRAGADDVREMLQESIKGLGQGENLLLYPAGRIYRSYMEDLRGASAVETVLAQLPDVRVVLVRTRGLWGSGFGRASGRPPQVGRTLLRGLLGRLSGGMFFAPRRRVQIEFFEPDDLPRQAGRNQINRYLEQFYNQQAQHNTFVPYSIWRGRSSRLLPEPPVFAAAGDASGVPPSTREIVEEELRELSGKSRISDGDLLGSQLGLDSLARTELGVLLESQFGFKVAADGLVSVADVLLAACGQGVGGERQVAPPPGRWFTARRGPGQDSPAGLPAGDTLNEVFLAQYALGPNRPLLADQIGGVRSFRQVMTGVLALQGSLAKLPGQRLGIMLPAGVAATVSYLAALFAGKTPVMVNWTAGPRNLRHGLEELQVRSVLTARALTNRLGADGLDLSGIQDRLVFLEDLAGGFNWRQKLRAAVRARWGWRGLALAAAHDPAVILFTSGSENLPKAVPLTHANILANLRDVLAAVKLYPTDILLGLLPPFHAFGLTVGTVLPLVSGMRVAYWPNPNDAAGLAGAVEAYRTTLLVGAPTFLAGIVRAARRGQLDSLRLIVSGAEACPPRLYQALADACPRAVVLEGYGVTECSPIVTLNDEQDPYPGAIGRPLPSLACLVVDPQTMQPCPPGEPGLLLVSGPSVFGGYLNWQGPSPFAELIGRRWYNTGDLVSADQTGLLRFHGRLKRFAKLGGEMISLPAIEAVLAEAFENRDAPHFPAFIRQIESSAARDEKWGASLFSRDEKWGASLFSDEPVFAVVAHPPEGGELVLFSAIDLTREQANAAIRQAGLSPLHQVRRVVRLERLPLLGSGKVDYRALRPD